MKVASGSRPRNKTPRQVFNGRLTFFEILADATKQQQREDSQSATFPLVSSFLCLRCDVARWGRREV
jgi:hypothetical protein